jgi:hypothetical protein
MNGLNLGDHGDAEERGRWPALRLHFPLYEEFWRLQVFPLRGANGGIRTDIDGRLELMAQEHYKCFLSLSIALGNLNDEAHPERIFSSLQNAGNRAKQVVRYFNDIRAECIPANPDPIDAEPLADFCRDIADYRNYVHEDVMGMIEYQQRRYLPKPDRLDQYRRWSRLQNANLADFDPLSGILRAQFDRLTALLDYHWHLMLDRSAQVFASPRFAQLLPPPPAQAHVMQQIALSSNVRLG